MFETRTSPTRVLATLSLLTALGLTMAPQVARAQLSNTMIEFASALDEIRVLSYRDLPTDEEQQEALRTATEKLEIGAVALQNHAGSDDASLLAYALAQSSRLLRLAISRRDTAQVDELLTRATQACAGCHARKLPTSAAGYASVCPSGAPDCDLAPAANVKELLSHTRYWVATRQFARAAQECGEWLSAKASRSLESDDLPALQQLADIKIGNLNQASRLKKQLQSLLAKNAHPTVANTVQSWIASLERHASSNAVNSTPAATLAKARALINPSLQHGYLESERVEHLLARALAQQVHDHASSSATQAAEASYLLGVIEHRLSGGGWVPLRELYFEQAILNAPHTPLARRAYRALDATLQAAMTGAVRDPEVEQHLRQLEALAAP